MTKKQLIVLGGICLFVGIILGAILISCLHHCPEPVPTDSTLIDSLRTQNDIKDGKIQIRDSIIKANGDRQQFMLDSIIIKNNKDLKPLYDKIIMLDDSARAVFIDQRLKRAGIRR